MASSSLFVDQAGYPNDPGKNMNSKFKTNNPEYPHVNPFGNMLFSSLKYINHFSLIEGLLTVFSLYQTFQTPYMNIFCTCFFEFLVTRKQFPHDVIVCEVPIWNPLKIGVYRIPSKKATAEDDNKTSEIRWVSPFGTKPTNQPFSSQMTT